ncbi:hypothetical protein AX774_g4986 [Zancudomyces culisetae]|uniref:Secreted protein n=1 Tax=Zancudomyces culisetae TaxID=1213189 RepID=A0A1R1PKV3_ZANCU|nr:hypothetical protein AX774_g4986 [Zancudomyces culisetae]|eukprot:OMH81553.1 hypothetical protein AX774_g4986 [Zancudomyces culisetae]
MWRFVSVLSFILNLPRSCAENVHPERVKVIFFLAEPKLQVANPSRKWAIDTSAFWVQWFHVHPSMTDRCSIFF